MKPSVSKGRKGIWDGVCGWDECTRRRLSFLPQERYAFHRWQATVFNAGELTDPIKNAISASFQRKGGSLTATLRINAAQRPDSYCSKYSDSAMRLNSPNLLDSSCVGELMVGQVVGGVEHWSGK